MKRPTETSPHEPCAVVDVRMWRHSGVGVYLRGTVEEMARLEQPPRLVCLGPDEWADDAAALHGQWRSARFNAPVYGIREQIFLPNPAPGWALFHAPHYNYPLRWPSNRPLVVTVHDLIHLDSPNRLKRLYMRFFLRRLQARAAKGTLKVLVGSNATRERLLEAAPQLSQENVRRIPYGLSRNFLKGPPAPGEIEAWRARRRLPSDYLLMVGIALPHKNHEFVVRSLWKRGAGKGPVRPVVVCGMDPAGVERLRRIARESGPADALVSMPRLPDAELPFLYAGATALVFPSLVEGFGLPIIEAQAMGVPTIVSDRPAPREAGGDAAVYFDPTDGDSLVATVERVLSDADLRSGMTERGRRRVAGMTWAETARQTVEAYRELAGDGIVIAPSHPRPDRAETRARRGGPPAEGDVAALDAASGAVAAPVGAAKPGIRSDARVADDALARAELIPEESLGEMGATGGPGSAVFLEKRVALVHDWLYNMRGGECVLEEILGLLPQADIHTLFYEPDRVSPTINCRRIAPSVLQGFPFSRRLHRHLLPLYPWAMRRMKLSEYDVVISISSCAAKAAPVPRGKPHVCYCLSPARYFYDQYDAYFGGLPWPLSWTTRRMVDRLIEWDQNTSWRVSHFIAISKFVAERIRNVYRREAEIIYPPVAIDFFTPPPRGTGREDFFLIVAEAVAYKRLDVVVDAFNRLGWPLVIVARGPQLKALQRAARDNVRFVTRRLTRPELRDLYQRAQGFIYCAEEDFGLTPVEAQACGCPVVAYGRGGVAETVIHERTGLLFEEQSKVSLIDALRDFVPGDFNPLVIRRNAERFGRDRFCREFLRAVSRAISER
ncbi:MAG TPA: glycosyltransferase [Sumerlaeia bacterium]|nr:glycosyltransferase [Sumerlaeia bacterium]